MMALFHQRFHLGNTASSHWWCFFARYLLGYYSTTTGRDLGTEVDVRENLRGSSIYRTMIVPTDGMLAPDGPMRKHLRHIPTPGTLTETGRGAL